MSAHRVGDVVVSADAGVVWALIDRPERRNAINLEVVAGLEAAVEAAVATEAKVLAVRGAGGTFSSGADLELLSDLVGDEAALQSFMRRLGRVLERLETEPFVSLAIVEGYALAGGCELVLAADLSLASTDARIGDRHAEYGLVPAARGSVRLSDQLPRAVANYLLLTGDMIDGRRAARSGSSVLLRRPPSSTRSSRAWWSGCVHGARTLSAPSSSSSAGVKSAAGRRLTGESSTCSSPTCATPQT
jgi:enoyl-CoA hydratase/carnithine racemase